MAVFNLRQSLAKAKSDLVKAFSSDTRDKMNRSYVQIQSDFTKFGTATRCTFQHGYAITAEKVASFGPWVAGASAAIIGAAVTPIAAKPILGLVGFTAIGVLKGSPAATIQATIGIVKAGSWFSLAQSIAMGGATVPWFGVVIGGLILGVLVLVAAILIRAAVRWYLARRAAKKAGVGSKFAPFSPKNKC